MSELGGRTSLPEEGCAPEFLWLGTGDQAAFTILHRPAAPLRSGSAALLCPPFGWGESCAYRDLRIWAQALAGAGVACARIWPPGVGDAGGTPHRPDQLAQWTAAVAEAAGWLRETTGAGRIVAIGVGLGGMTACRAAELGADIDDFVLWGVPARGRVLMRHERLHAGVVTAVSVEPIAVEPNDGDGLQLIGYRLGADAAAALGGLELHPENLAPRESRRALLLGCDGLAVDGDLRARFEAGGVAVTTADGPDWLELVGPLQQTVPPSATIARTIDWIRAEVPRAPDASRASASGTVDLDRAHPRVRRLHVGSTALVDGSGVVRERIVRLSGDLGEAFAIASEPEGHPAAPLTAVWLSPHHVGPSRIWVEVARRWAQRGVATVRVDLSGQGESGGPSPRPLPDRFLYAQQRTGYLPAVLDQLADQGFAPHFVVGGYCAGAYWALRAALEHPGVRAVMLLNLYVLSYSDELVQERLGAQLLEDIGSRAWRRLVARQLSSGEVRRGLRTLRQAYTHRGMGRPLERGYRRESERVLESLGERGIETLFVLCQDESLLAELEEHRSTLQRWPNVTVEVMPTRDHQMWELSVQAMVHASVDRALARALEPGLSLSA